MGASVSGSSRGSALAYYTAHDVLTDPGVHADRLNELSVTLPELHAALDGLLIHAWKVRAFHPHLFAYEYRWGGA